MSDQLTQDQLTGADQAAAQRARDRLAEADLLIPMGRLASLATWWAGVRGDDRAAPPTRVLTLEILVDGMSVDQAITWAVAGVDDAVDRGVELILLAVRDDAAARLVAARMLALTAVEASGWPLENGLDDEDWMDAVTDLRDGLWRLRGRSEVTEVLREVASPDLAAATAIALHAAGRRTPVLLDGEGATCAALLARRGGYAANQWWQIAHTAGSSLMDQAIASLQLDPILRLGLRVQDGTGARLGLEVLVEAARLLAR